jgi:hypothetical protein
MAMHMMVVLVVQHMRMCDSDSLWTRVSLMSAELIMSGWLDSSTGIASAVICSCAQLPPLPRGPHAITAQSRRDTWCPRLAVKLHHTHAPSRRQITAEESGFKGHGYGSLQRRRCPA